MTTPSATIRPATLADAAFLAGSLIAIARSLRDRPGSPYNALLPETVTPREFEYAAEFVRNGAKLALVAEEGGLAIGCLLAEIAASSVPTLRPGRVGNVAACWVSPESRKKGTGRMLAKKAEEWFRERGARFAELSYGADSETAGAAWTAQGYAPFRVFAVKDLEAGKM
jgi:GNAT superfamily N-acetyltransferase